MLLSVPWGILALYAVNRSSLCGFAGAFEFGFSPWASQVMKGLHIQALVVRCFGLLSLTAALGLKSDPFIGVQPRPHWVQSDWVVCFFHVKDITAQNNTYTLSILF